MANYKEDARGICPILESMLESLGQKIMFKLDLATSFIRLVVETAKIASVILAIGAEEIADAGGLKRPHERFF